MIKLSTTHELITHIGKFLIKLVQISLQYGSAAPVLHLVVPKDIGKGFWGLRR